METVVRKRVAELSDRVVTAGIEREGQFDEACLFLVDHCLGDSAALDERTFGSVPGGKTTRIPSLFDSLQHPLLDLSRQICAVELSHRRVHHLEKATGR
ncbi:MAG: hypothetical protein WBQ14_02115 [Gaiellaceae bacterium]